MSYTVGNSPWSVEMPGYTRGAVQYIQGKETRLQTLRRLEQTQSDQRAIFESVLGILPVPIQIISHENGEILYKNLALSAIVGDVRGKCYDVYREEGHGRGEKCVNCPIGESVSTFHEIPVRKQERVEGMIQGRNYEIQYIPFVFEGRQAILEAFFDVTERVEAQQRAEAEGVRVKEILNTSPDGHLLIDQKTLEIKKINSALTEITGYSAEELLGGKVKSLLSLRNVWRVLRGEPDEVRGKKLVYRFPFTKKCGEKIQISISVAKMDTGEFNVTVRDITQRKELEDKLEKDAQLLQNLLNQANQLREESERAKKEAETMAITDPLTDLWNRRGFSSFAEREWEKAKRHGQNLFVAMLDIDNFKHINDTYGHDVGDKCLQHLAKILKENTRASDDVPARWGGEEFILLLTGIGKPGAHDALEKIRKAVEDLQVEVDGKKINFTVSIGFAKGPDEAESLDALQKQADAALYKAKHAGKNRIEFATA